MKLSIKSKDELRKFIEERIIDIPENQKLQLDKKILEDLLFETITIDKEKEIILKLPVWSGEFLKKIDLSQVDFTNVSWAILNSDPDNICSMEIEGITVDDRAYECIRRIRNSIIEKKNGLQYITVYSGTNANIDLTKSYEALHRGGIDVRSCDFSESDFSKIDLSNRSIYFDAVNISRTSLQIPDNAELLAYSSNFEGIDLSSRTINAFAYFLYYASSSLPYCILRNTGTNITLNLEQFKEWDLKEELNKAMNEDWVGCYVNEKRVLSKEEKEKNAQEQKMRYEEIENAVFHYINKEIELTKRLQKNN